MLNINLLEPKTERLEYHTGAHFITASTSGGSWVVLSVFRGWTRSYYTVSKVKDVRVYQTN